MTCGCGVPPVSACLWRHNAVAWLADLAFRPCLRGHNDVMAPVACCLCLRGYNDVMTPETSFMCLRGYNDVMTPVACFLCMRGYNDVIALVVWPAAVAYGVFPVSAWL